VTWAGEAAVRAGARAIVPAAERDRFEKPEAFWAEYESRRFHDYSQVNTRVPRRGLPVAQAVRGGDRLTLDGVAIEVVDTPGYTPGAVSYLVETGGKRIACTGDLIYGDGQLLDITSLQDAIPESKTRGYHGYAARAGALIASLRAIAARNPDAIAPARGPLIENPRVAIERLIGRMQALMASHFATDALRWYWGEESLRLRSQKALDGRAVDSMPMAEQSKLPEWALAAGNSRVLVSSTGAAFLIDAGYRGLPAAFDKWMAAGLVRNVEGIWITHYHDDHTDLAQSLAVRFGCPVYYTDRMAGVMARPGDYRLPCLTTAGVKNGRPQHDGARLRWREFQFTFFDFPGQTLYHGGMLAERDGGGALFFTGDSFTPSGVDDYCLQNRNFAGAGEGLQYCLRVLERLRPDAWLINQHVEPTFRFSAAQFERMRSELRKRAAILKELAPWPDGDYAVDENWAAVHPYGSRVRAGERVQLTALIRNHGAARETYRVKWNAPEGWRQVSVDAPVTIEGKQEGTARAEFLAAGAGLHVVTADIEFGGRTLREWTEALVRVEAPEGAFVWRAPTLRTSDRKVDQAFRIALGDLAGNVVEYRSGLLARPAPVLVAGLGYATPWTRDASVNVWNGLSLIAPEVARNTLLAVVEETGSGPRIVGGDQYWDAVVWASGAWRHYLATADREFLKLALRAVENSLAFYEATEFDATDGLFRGPGWSDGVSGYPDAYAATKGESGIQAWPKANPARASHPGFGIPMKALSTNCLYYGAYRAATAMRDELGLAADAALARKAEQLRQAINAKLWDERRGHYLFLTGPFGPSGRQEALGHAYAILFGVADARQARLIFEHQHVAPAGVPCLWPNLERYRGPDGKGFARHAGTVWPQIQGMWALAAALHGRVGAFAHELTQLAGHATRDRQFAEVYHPLTGEIYGGWQERKGRMALWTAQPRQSWAASAFVRMAVHGLAGVELERDGVRFAPCAPPGIGPVELGNLQVREARLDVTVRGQGARVRRLMVAGVERKAGETITWRELGAGPVAVVVEVE
jgi:glyoxylase-like metal-dependent hydrolase (beta-lactamase superfamily II)